MDNGLTFTVQPVTGSTPIRAIRPSGLLQRRVYFGYVAGDGHPHITVSMTRDAPGTMTRMFGAPFSMRNTVFPEVVAGDNDRASSSSWARLRLAMAQAQTPALRSNGVWHGYIATTYNGGKTWFTVDATPTIPCSSG